MRGDVRCFKEHVFCWMEALLMLKKGGIVLFKLGHAIYFMLQTWTLPRDTTNRVQNYAFIRCGDEICFAARPK